MSAVTNTVVDGALLVARLEPDAVAPDTLGGKGGALAGLVTGGYPVPRTGVVTTEAYRAVAADEGVRRLIDRIAAGDEVPADEVDAIFDAAPMPSAIREAVVDLVAWTGAGGPVAVRSSATVEDLHGSSFAGQYRSVLDVDSGDRNAVLGAVRRVWASLWHPAPSAYRRAFGIEETDVAMAVVVMRMVPATTAGVVFTVDPAGGAGSRIEAVEGLGESLVSGERTPAAWVVPDDPTEAPGDGQQALADLPFYAREALGLARRVAAAVGVPQDVEWAADGDDVFVVQARPITVLADQDGFDTAVDDHELTTAGIVEMVPGVLPPLRWELNRFVLEEAFRSVLDTLGILRGEAAEDRSLVRRVRGRMAIDFDLLRQVASGIPGAVAELEQQYFGHAASAVAEPDAGRKERRGLRSTLDGLRRDLLSLQTERRMDSQAEIGVRAVQLIRSRRPLLASMTDDELLAYSRRLVDVAARCLTAELGVAAAAGAAFRKLELQLGRYLGADAGSAAAQRLTAGSGVIHGRQRFASAAIFAGPTWLELELEPPAPSRIDSAERLRRRDDLEESLRALPGWTRRRILTGQIVDTRIHLIRRRVGEVVDRLRRREEAKAAFLELGGEVRRVHLELGRRLVEAGVLTRRADVELLTTSELIGVIAERVTITSDVIGRRRNWIGRYETEGPLPVRFVGVPEREPVPLPEGDRLDGWAAGPGRERGVARVVRHAGGVLDAGEILVAESTDASWSPLFVLARAIVVERGGPLSHAAILARELGLPAVLNVEGATRVLDGALVSVDGDAGVVVIEERSEP